MAGAEIVEDFVGGDKELALAGIRPDLAVCRIDDLEICIPAGLPTCSPFLSWRVKPAFPAAS